MTGAEVLYWVISSGLMLGAAWSFYRDWFRH